MNRQNGFALVPGWMRWLFYASVLVLAVSGAGQMPIFKRYYVADIPGLGFLAQFYVTHALHYAGAIVFLFLGFYFAGRYLADWRRTHALTVTGKVKLGFFAAVIITGVLRLLKNFPDITFSPNLTMAIDWAHLFLAMFLGFIALWAALTKRAAYLTR